MTDRPQEIRRELVLCNFRKPIRERLKKEPSSASKRPGMSEEHLRQIRVLPCCACGKLGPSDPHHLKSGLSNERGIGRKATDRWTVPLCRSCHDAIEAIGSRRETSWFIDLGIDPLELASALWNATGDPHRMLKILRAHMGAKG